MPAPATRPSARASASACSSTSPPRAALMMRTPGLTISSSRAPISPTVSGVLGRWMEMKSRLAQQLLEPDQPHAQLGGAGRLHVRVVSDQARAEGGHPLGEQHPDAAQADHADGLAGDLDAGVARALPLAGLERGGSGDRVAGHRQQQRHRLLSRGDDVRGRRVDHHDPAGGGGRHLDVVQADPGPGDHLQPWGGGDRRGVDLGRGRVRSQPRPRRARPAALRDRCRRHA